MWGKIHLVVVIWKLWCYLWNGFSGCSDSSLQVDSALTISDFSSDILSAVDTADGIIWLVAILVAFIS